MDGNAQSLDTSAASRTTELGPSVACFIACELPDCGREIRKIHADPPVVAKPPSKPNYLRFSAHGASRSSCRSSRSSRSGSRSTSTNRKQAASRREMIFVASDSAAFASFWQQRLCFAAFDQSHVLDSSCKVDSFASSMSHLLSSYGLCQAGPLVSSSFDPAITVVLLQHNDVITAPLTGRMDLAWELDDSTTSTADRHLKTAWY